MIKLTKNELELALFALNNYAKNMQPTVYCLPENVADKKIIYGPMATVISIEEVPEKMVVSCLNRVLRDVHPIPCMNTPRNTIENLIKKLETKNENIDFDSCGGSGCIGNC